MFNLLLKNPKLRAAGLVALIVALCLLPLFADNKYYLHIFIFIFLNIIWAGTLRLIWTTGQIAFGQPGKFTRPNGPAGGHEVNMGILKGWDFQESLIHGRLSALRGE